MPYTETAFTARRICIARTMPWQISVCPSVCLSVRPSHAGIVCKRLHIFSNFLHHRVVQPLCFFRTKWDGNIPTGSPLTEAPNARGYDKNTICDQYRAKELMQDTAIVTMEGE